MNRGFLQFIQEVSVAYDFPFLDTVRLNVLTGPKSFLAFRERGPSSVKKWVVNVYKLHFYGADNKGENL